MAGFVFFFGLNKLLFSQLMRGTDVLFNKVTHIPGVRETDREGDRDPAASLFYAREKE